jgi:hypothetical protein
MYAEEYPRKITSATSTRLNVENNRWKLIAFVLGIVVASVVGHGRYTVRVAGVSADVGGHLVTTEPVANKPQIPQTLRTSFKEMAVRWFTIEPILIDRLETARMTRNINSVKAQMIDAGWLYSDAPFHPVSAKPKRALG